MTEIVDRPVTTTDSRYGEEERATMRQRIAERVAGKYELQRSEGVAQTQPKAGKGLHVKRRFSTEGIHPYDEITWVARDVVMRNWRDNTINFEQYGVEFPDFMSDNAVNIVVSKYFRGKKNTPGREWSFRQLIDRVVFTYVEAGRVWGYFASDEDAKAYEEELTWLLAHGYFAFNSPVWFNVGWPQREEFVSACFILSVDDTMDSILNWYREEGLIFKGGSGAGVNLSRIRSSKELLSAGGTASGPTSFMRGADASAGAIKSGGSTRRAAKMVVLNVDHPDIEEFIDLKKAEEKKIRVLRDNGFDMDLGGRDINSVQYQNANNSVRVSDEFMQAVEEGREFHLRARMDNSVVSTVDAKSLFRKLAQAAWECADPGIQYDDTINDWHTNSNTGPITASNPCSEYLSLDNSSCNLASLNLMRFRREDGNFDAESFEAAVEHIITAMDISICFADFPTDAIRDTTRNYRQLGIGFCNLGALLMASGLPYDSDQGRTLAAAITSLMTGVAYRRSAELAAMVGPYQGYKANQEPHQRVMRKHAAANDDIRSTDDNVVAIKRLATLAWQEGLRTGEKSGWRNAQASLQAPTGTISFFMDADTTGIEPDLALVKYKKLADGGDLVIINRIVPVALRQLGYAPAEVQEITEYIKEKGNAIGAPGLKPEHLAVFDCAVGERSISWQGHVRMMAAMQPLLSGAQSKTVNLPSTATVEDVEQVYFQGWKLGLKCLAVYVDNSKASQPLNDAKAAKAGEEAAVTAQPARRKLPWRRPAETISFQVGSFEGYMTLGTYPDTGELAEVFIKGAKQGTILAGLLDAFSIEFSMGRQYHVPLEVVLGKYIGMAFEPAGMTRHDPDIRMATSIMDYIARRLALDFLPFDVRAGLGVYTAEERERYNDTGSYLQSEEEPAGDSALEPKAAPPAVPQQVATAAGDRMLRDAPICTTCGVQMRPSGSCYACEQCGSTSGCS